MARGVTLVTGASAGLGVHFARRCRERGDELVLVARRRDRLEALAAELGSAHVIAADLALPGAAGRLLAEVAELGLEVDILFNYAGFGAAGAFVEAPAERLLEMIDLNVRALTELCRLALPPMLERRRGFILNVASTAAFQAGPYSAVYYATKAYVLSFSEALFCELAPRGVRVTVLCPGSVPTEFQERAGIVPGFDSRVLNISAANVALAGYRGLMAGKRLVLPGLGMKMIPFMLRFVPRAWVVALVGRVQSGR